jgi:hypothetical protein
LIVQVQRKTVRSASLIVALLSSAACTRDRRGEETRPRVDPVAITTATVALAPFPMVVATDGAPPHPGSAAPSSGTIVRWPGCDAVMPARDLCDGVQRLLAGMPSKFAGMRCPKDDAALTPGDFDTCTLYVGTRSYAFDRSFACNAAAIPASSLAAETARRSAALAACLKPPWVRSGAQWYVDPELVCELTSGDDPGMGGVPASTGWISLQCRHYPPRPVEGVADATVVDAATD